MKTGSEWWTTPLEEEYKKHPRLKREDVLALREWLTKQPHLPNIPDNLLAVFLCSCDFSMEQTKVTIDINYTIRTRLPNVFSNRNISRPASKLVTEYLQYGLMPQTDDSALLVLGFRPSDVSKFIAEDYYQLFFMYEDITNLTLGLVPKGYHFLYDMTNFYLGHLLRLPLNLTAEIMKYAQEGSCCRIEGVHIINGGTIVEKVLAFLRPFMGAELKKRIHIYNSKEDLLKVLGAKNVPKDLGGDGPGVEEISRETIKQLEEYSPWFSEEEKWRVLEDKRPEDNRVAESLAGSFRKLEVD